MHKWLEIIMLIEMFSQLYEDQSIKVMEQYPTLLINSGKLLKLSWIRNIA